MATSTRIGLHRTRGNGEIRRWCVAIVSLVATAVAAGMLVSAAPATPPAQRIVIEQKLGMSARNGTFELLVLTPGPLADDSGTFAHRDGITKGAIRGGQGVATYVLVTEYEGRRGTFFARERIEFVAAGNGYTVGTGTWKLVAGTEAYARIAARGYEGSVLTTAGIALTQSEGLVTASEP